MGDVFLARQCSLGRTVAIKFLSPRRGGDSEEQRQRFEREARLMAQVVHPNIVTVFDRGSIDDRDYFVMEYVEGKSLESLLATGGPLPAGQARRVLAAVLQALAFLHEKGVVHRDLKPSNVLIDSDGQVKLTDFGISVALDEMGQLTDTGQALGSWDYVAPEQRSRLPVDQRADQFALAVVAYEVLTGRRPCGNFKPPSQLNLALNPEVDRVLSRALQEDPDDRYPTVEQFGAALDRALAGPRGGKFGWSRFALVAAGLLAAVGVGFTAFWVAQSERVEPSPFVMAARSSNLQTANRRVPLPARAPGPASRTRPGRSRTRPGRSRTPSRVMWRTTRKRRRRLMEPGTWGALFTTSKPPRG
jgi:serine/threonine protein kinase